MLLMRGLAKLSQAIVETQSSTLRSGASKFSCPVMLLKLKNMFKEMFFREVYFLTHKLMMEVKV